MAEDVTQLLVQWGQVDQQQSTGQNRAQFFGLACQVMRNRSRLKRGGGAVQLRLSEAIETAPAKQDLDLAKLDPEQSRIIELRYFAGLTGRVRGNVS